MLTGLAARLLAFLRAREGTTCARAHDMFQEVSDHAVTKTRGFLQPRHAGGRGDRADLGLATGDLTASPGNSPSSCA